MSTQERIELIKTVLATIILSDKIKAELESELRQLEATLCNKKVTL